MKEKEFYVDLFDRNGTIVPKQIKLTNHAIAEFEEKSKMSFFGIIARFGRMSVNVDGDSDALGIEMMELFSATMLRTMIWAGLLWRSGAPLTIKQVGEMMPIKVKAYAKNVMSIMGAMNAAVAEDKDDVEEAINENFTSAEPSQDEQRLEESHDE